MCKRKKTFSGFSFFFFFFALGEFMLLEVIVRNDETTPVYDVLLLILLLKKILAFDIRASESLLMKHRWNNATYFSCRRYDWVGTQRKILRMVASKRNSLSASWLLFSSHSGLAGRWDFHRTLLPIQTLLQPYQFYFLLAKIISRGP